jgi:alanyl-tRNA synthetase
VTSADAYAYLHAKTHEVEELRDELTRARKDSKKPSKAAAAEVTVRDETDGIVVAEVKAMKGPELRDLSDQIRQSKQANAVLLGSVDDGRVYFVVNLDSSLVDQGADAVAIVKQAAKSIGGGGGGRPNLAEAGGRNPEGLSEAYEIARSELASAIA